MRSPYPAPPPASSSEAHGWWAYRSDSGAFGVRRGRPDPHQAAHNIYLGEAGSLADLVQKTASSSGPLINDALLQLGMPMSYMPTLIGQLDRGAVLHNPSYLELWPGSGPEPTIHSDAITKKGSEANPVNVIPSPIDPNVGNTGGGLFGSLSFLGFLGSLQFWKGIGLVLAGALILIFAALELRGGNAGGGVGAIARRVVR